MIPAGSQWQEIAALTRGEIAQTSYAVVLAALARAGRDARLALERKPVAKEIAIARGVPVDCRSNLAHETLGRFLLAAGRISADDHRDALAEALRRAVPLGEVLIGRELLTPEEVLAALQQNLGRKLLDGFTWTRGSFTIADADGELDATVRVNAPQLLLTGVTKLTPPAEVAAAVRGWAGADLELDPEPPFADAGLRLTAGAERVVDELARAPASIDRLAGATGLESERLGRLVYALALAGRVVRRDARAARRRPRRAPGREEPAAAVAPAPAVAPPPVDPELLRRESRIVEAYLGHQRRDAFDFLGVGEDAEPAAVERAYLAAAETFAPWRLATGGSRFVGEARQLFLRAARAFAELSDRESRGTLLRRRKVLREDTAARRRPDLSIETDLLDPEVQFRKGRELLVRGRAREGLELLRFAADCDAQNPVYRAEAAYRAYELDPAGGGQRALEELEETLRIDSKSGLAHYYYGLVLADAGRQAVAEEHLRRSIKLLAPDRRPIEALKELAARGRRR